jgi:putative membrane protein
MTTGEIGDILAKLNAGLNMASFVLVLAGYVQIKRKRRASHETFMKLAFVTSATFLVSYLVRYGLTGSHHLAAGGWVKAGYLALLVSHMFLAAVTVPLVLRTLFLARGARFGEHRKIAKVTFPIWAYVSVTGVIVYAVLYHLVGTVETTKTPPQAGEARLTDPVAASTVPAPR